MLTLNFVCKGKRYSLDRKGRPNTLVYREYAPGLDLNLLQDGIKRKSTKAARNLDTIHRIVYSLFSIRKGRRKKLSEKAKGPAELMRHVSMSFTGLLHFLSQK